MAFERLSNFFGMSDDDEDINMEENNEFYDDEKVVQMTSTSTATRKTSKIIISEPRDYSDAKEISKHLMTNKAVLINLASVDAIQAKRIIDFLTGTVFAINGEMKAVNEKIFLCTPSKFEIGDEMIEKE